MSWNRNYRVRIILTFSPVMFCILYNRPQEILYIYTHSVYVGMEYWVYAVSVFLILSLISLLPKISVNYVVALSFPNTLISSLFCIISFWRPLSFLCTQQVKCCFLTFWDNWIYKTPGCASITLRIDHIPLVCFSIESK